MADCIHCGEPAGWFRQEHPKCRDVKQQQADAVAAEQAQVLPRLVEKLRLDLIGTTPLIDIEAHLLDQSAAGTLAPAQRTECLVKAWEGAVDSFLDDGILTDEEEARLNEAVERFMLPPALLDRSGALSRVGKSAVLKVILRGDVPPEIPGLQVSVNLLKSEHVVWVFNGVKYLEDREQRQFVGGSQGVSLRVMSGVYYRIGGFKGKSVYSTKRVHVDTGRLLVTTKNLYFVGPAKSVRIPYAKIVSFEQFNDGIGIMRDLASAKPQIFVTEDGWFSYNLIANLAQQ